MDERAIGIFDSGVGGLAVLWALADLLPSERLVYYADAAYFPYGERDAAHIRALTLAAAERLRAEHDIKLLVVACNTATSAALSALRAHLPIPVVGIEPAIRPAVALTRRGRIGVLATRGTVEGSRLDALITCEAGGVMVTVAPAPAMVEAVERGLMESDAIEPLLREALTPLVAAEVDVVVLGCTHFAFMRGAIERLLGPSVSVLEPSAAVARQAARVLRERDLLAPPGRRGGITYSSSGDGAELTARAAALYPPAPFPLPGGKGGATTWLGGAVRDGEVKQPSATSVRTSSASIEAADPLPPPGRDSFAGGEAGLGSPATPAPAALTEHPTALLLQPTPPRSVPLPSQGRGQGLGA